MCWQDLYLHCENCASPVPGRHRTYGTAAPGLLIHDETCCGMCSAACLFFR